MGNLYNYLYLFSRRLNKFFDQRNPIQRRVIIVFIDITLILSIFIFFNFTIYDNAILLDNPIRNILFILFYNNCNFNLLFFRAI